MLVKRSAGKVIDRENVMPYCLRTTGSHLAPEGDGSSTTATIVYVINYPW